MIVLDTNVLSVLMPREPDQAVVAGSRATLATRNQRHFDGLGISLVDPWGARAGPLKSR